MHCSTQTQSWVRIPCPGRRIGTGQTAAQTQARPPTLTRSLVSLHALRPMEPNHLTHGPRSAQRPEAAEQARGRRGLSSGPASPSLTCLLALIRTLPQEGRRVSLGGWEPVPGQPDRNFAAMAFVARVLSGWGLNAGRVLICHSRSSLLSIFKTECERIHLRKPVLKISEFVYLCN